MIKTSLKIIRLLVVAAAVLACVDLFYDMVTAGLNLPATGDVSQNTLQSDIRSSDTDDPAFRQPAYTEYTAIFEKDLFQTGPSKASGQPETVAELDNLAKTELDLRLWGTITGTDEKAYAVIEEQSKNKQALYRQGDTIDQARIKMILRKKVVLTVNGKDEILEMEELLDPSGRMSQGGPGRGAEAFSRQADSSEQSMSISGQRINEAMQDVNSLMRQVRIRPYFENGQPAGLMLSGIQSDSVFSEMGLESGDIIKSINGRRIESVEDAMNFYQNIESSGQVELEIQREGSSQTFSYQID